MAPVRLSVAWAALWIAAAVLLTPAPTRADGPCGVDATGPTACHIRRDGIYDGSLTPARDAGLPADEHDYYVFRARAGTRVTVTLTDAEDTDCALQGLLICGDLTFAINDRMGNGLTGSVGHGSNGGVSTIRQENSAAAVFPTRVRFRVPRTGRYYIAVSGVLERNLYENAASEFAAVPYTLAVTARPALSWPAPRRHRHRHR